MRDMAHSICLKKLYQITMRKKFRSFVSDYLKHHYQRHKSATRHNISIKQDLFLNMAAGREDRHHGGRTKWTDKLCIDLISCREQASTIYSTDECPRKENGKKVGIMELIKRFWDSMCYSRVKPPRI